MSNGKRWSVPIRQESDIVRARTVGREAAKALGFGLTDITRIVTAASELARNIYRYADEGEMSAEEVTRDGKSGIELVFADKGPGIPDVELALSEGYSSSKTMGMGLPGAKKLMDEMTIESTEGIGATVTIIKWKR